LAGFASGQQTLVKQVGADAAHRMWDISVEALDLLNDLVERYSIDCDLHWGTMLAAVKPRQRAALLEEFEETRTVYGYDHLEFLEREQVEALVATKRYCAALLDRGSGHLHPLNYTLGLAAAARKHGVSIYEE